MAGFFRRKPKERQAADLSKIRSVSMQALDYHPKIILAWAKAIEGEEDFGKWLSENGFPELTVACSAIRLKDEAREWLMNNGYPHLMAMINAAEGNAQALNWLKLNNMDILYHIAEAVENEQESWAWLKQNTTQDIFMLAQSIKKVKDEIEENHNDIHSFGKDL